MYDKEIEQVIADEQLRQKNNIELIASENYCSKEVREAVGSILTNKYAEGYPGARYYGGCENVDRVENLARERACALFGADHANVQPHSGSQANMAVYEACLQPGDRLLGMSLDAGGHLTHGYKMSFSGKKYDAFGYGVNPDTEMLDYDEIDRIAQYIHPRLIVAGASAYARTIDFARFREIADRCGAMLMVDMAHIAGLVAAGEHPSPVPYADFVTTTTHKTLRGPRGGMILCREQYAKAVDKAVFPTLQGGPLCHVIAGKAICLYEASQPEFKTYAHQIILNAKELCRTLQQRGFRIVSGGTDNHMVLVDTKSTLGLTGRDVETLLDSIHITVNKNAIPFDKERPAYTSGVRLGTPAMTTRGFKEAEFHEVGMIIADVCTQPNNAEVRAKAASRVLALTDRFPVL